jgi:hypothetical protein
MELETDRQISARLAGCNSRSVNARAAPSRRVRVATAIGFRLASGAKWRLAERRVALVRLLVKVRHQQWVRAESAKAYRPPTLLEDNPASGDRQRRGE